MNEMRNACERKPAMRGREYHRLDEWVGGMRDGEGVVAGRGKREVSVELN
jgi:hypothetical protein